MNKLAVKDNSRKMNLIILGALPPPRGGVTTHVERLIPCLEEAGIGYVIWDYSKRYKGNKHVISLRREPLKVVASLLKMSGVKVSHCLISSVSFSRLMFCLFLKIIGIRLTITLVGSPKEMIDNHSLKLFYILALARFSSHIIAVNRDFQMVLVNHGISENKVSIIPAFIPFKNNVSIEKPVPQSMVDFCLRHKPLIVTYAYGPLFYAKEDLYGLDLFVQLARRLRKDFPQAGFVVVIPEISNKGYFGKVGKDIEKNDLDSMFCLAIGGHLSFVPFLQYTDLFIRATNTDGDALTLREALYCGVPSVASDVCCRPEGTILFRNRDISDLCRVVREALNNNRNSQYSTGAQQINNAELFIGVFKRTAGLRE